MSYSRSARTSITVSGSRTVSYPASEHGGYTTVHFTETVPVTVNVYVDTEEFDETVVETSGQVDLLTGAVVAMDEAQRAEIERSSKRISARMIDGFYNLINSDLSMQKAENKSSLQAKFTMLMTLAKDMVQKHERMNDELAKLQRHYHKIFSGLDEDLAKRIKMLDRNAFYLSEAIGHQLIIDPYKSEIGSSLSGIQEASLTNNLMVTARMKEKALDVLDHIGSSVDKSESFDRSVASVLHQEELEAVTTEYVPAVYCRKLNENGVPERNVYVPEIGHSEQIADSVSAYMNSTSDAQWKAMDEEAMQNIEQNLLSMIEEGASEDEFDQRVYQQMKELWLKDKKDIRQI